MNPIRAFGIADNFRVCCPFCVFIPVGTAIVHSVLITVLENRVVGTCIPFPGFVSHQNHFARLGLMQLECDSICRLDQVIIDK